MKGIYQQLRFYYTDPKLAAKCTAQIPLFNNRVKNQDIIKQQSNNMYRNRESLTPCKKPNIPCIITPRSQQNYKPNQQLELSTDIKQIKTTEWNSYQTEFNQLNNLNQDQNQKDMKSYDQIIQKINLLFKKANNFVSDFHRDQKFTWDKQSSFIQQQTVFDNHFIQQTTKNQQIPYRQNQFVPYCQGLFNQVNKQSCSSLQIQQFSEEFHIERQIMLRFFMNQNTGQYSYLNFLNELHQFQICKRLLQKNNKFEYLCKVRIGNTYQSQTDYKVISHFLSVWLDDMGYSQQQNRYNVTRNIKHLLNIQSSTINFQDDDLTIQLQNLYDSLLYKFIPFELQLMFLFELCKKGWKYFQFTVARIIKFIYKQTKSRITNQRKIYQKLQQIIK